MSNSHVYFFCSLVCITMFTLLYYTFDMDQCTVTVNGNPYRATGDSRVFKSSKVPFDISGKDVIVFMHIQKTGGSTFGRHLRNDLYLKRPCVCQKQKACKCLRPGNSSKMWLFSEFSVGWACGLHADWTEMTNCVPNMMDHIEKARQNRRYANKSVDM